MVNNKGLQAPNKKPRSVASGAFYHLAIRLWVSAEYHARVRGGELVDNGFEIEMLAGVDGQIHRSWFFIEGRV